MLQFVITSVNVTVGVSDGCFLRDCSSVFCVLAFQLFQSTVAFVAPCCHGIWSLRTLLFLNVMEIYVIVMDFTKRDCLSELYSVITHVCVRDS